MDRFNSVRRFLKSCLLLRCRVLWVQRRIEREKGLTQGDKRAHLLADDTFGLNCCNDEAASNLDRVGNGTNWHLAHDIHDLWVKVVFLHLAHGAAIESRLCLRELCGNNREAGDFAKRGDDGAS